MLLAQAEQPDLPIGRKKRIRIKAQAVERRIEKVEDRESEWLERLRREDDEILMLLGGR